MAMQTVEHVIGKRELAKTSPDASVSEACYVLDRLNVGALAVLEDDRLVGLLSERDVIRKCICKSRLTSATLVGDIMTPRPVTIDIGANLSEALRIMIERGFRHLPVTENGRTRGLLSMRDIPATERVALERALPRAPAEAAG